VRYSVSYRRMLNKMGYYDYQNGLIYRHLKQEGRWDDHLALCRNFILKSLDYYKPQKVTVLGSGWLLELPIAEMIEKTGKIYLVDIVHPPDVIAQAGKLKNVELIEEDISGGLIEEVWQKTRKFFFFNKLHSLENINIHEYEPDFDPGMVISLNILTQLESLLLTFLKNRSDISEEEYYAFRREIQNKHLNFLKKHPSVLITDYEEVITNKQGTITKISTMVTEIPANRFSEEWIWDFDQTGTDLNNSRSLMKVIAATI